jgi:hypothetical protein
MLPVPTDPSFNCYFPYQIGHCITAIPPMKNKSRAVLQ